MADHVGLGDFVRQKVEKAAFIIEMAAEVFIVSRIDDGEILHLTSERRVPFLFCGSSKIIFRYAEKVELVEKETHFFRKMRVGRSLDDHLELILLFIKDPSYDDLLPKRREGFCDRRVQFLKDAVGKARESADGDVCEAFARK